MHKIEPFNRWYALYDASQDQLSPFYGKEYNYELYSDTIYGYYIDPAWDFIGSETLYAKVLFADYDRRYVIMEFIGEWNDAISNDIMHLKRNVIDLFVMEGIEKFILIGNSVFNFHGSDDSYYEEWFEELEEGWIVGMGFQEHVWSEMKNYNIDMYINSGGPLEISNWRTMKPGLLFARVDELVSKRLGM